MSDFLSRLFGKKDEEEVVENPVEQPLTVGSDSPKVRNYIGEVYGDKFSDSARQKLKDENDAQAKAPDWGSALLGIGDAITGGNASGENMKAKALAREKSLTDFDASRKGLVDSSKLNSDLRDDSQKQEMFGRESDPNSDESKSAQALAVKMGMKPELAGKLTAESWKSRGPMYQKMYEIDQRSKDRSEARQDKKDLAMAKQNEGATAGRLAADKDFAKDYNDWTGAASAGVAKNLERLTKAKELLSKRKDDWFGTSGRVTGNLPDSMRSEESRTIRQDVQAAAQGALKATLGAQFTEKEGERIMKAAYDETLSPEANIAKIDAANKELQTAKMNKDAKSSYFEKNGTLTGFKSGMGGGEKRVVKMQRNPKAPGKVKVIYEDGSSEIKDEAGLAKNG